MLVSSAMLLPLVCVCLSACSAISGSDEYVINVDSVAVAAPVVQGGSVRTTYYGYVGTTACADLARVEREALLADTLRVRFIGRQRGGDCLQSPTPLTYIDSIPNLPARTVHLLVQQRSGVPLRYDIRLPLAVRP